MARQFHPLLRVEQQSLSNTSQLCELACNFQEIVVSQDLTLNRKFISLTAGCPRELLCRAMK
jgi:hypothetical protein